MLNKKFVMTWHDAKGVGGNEGICMYMCVHVWVHVCTQAFVCYASMYMHVCMLCMDRWFVFKGEYVILCNIL